MCDLCMFYKIFASANYCSIQNFHASSTKKGYKVKHGATKGLILSLETENHSSHHKWWKQCIKNWSWLKNSEKVICFKALPVNWENWKLNSSGYISATKFQKLQISSSRNEIRQLWSCFTARENKLNNFPRKLKKFNVINQRLIATLKE